MTYLEQAYNETQVMLLCLLNTTTEEEYNKHPLVYNTIGDELIDIITACQGVNYD